MAAPNTEFTAAPTAAGAGVAHPAAVAPAAPAAGTGFPTHASLYVGDLDPDVNEGMLFDIFSAVSHVASVRVCRDSTTRRSLGYAYVNFHNSTDADRALEMLNFTKIKDRPCRIMWSQRDPTLRKSGVGNIFIKNIAPSIDNKVLYDTFSRFGNILSCKVAMDPTGKSKKYGFVHFERQASAAESIAKVDGMEIAGEKVHVAHFRRRSDRSKAVEWTNLYVKNIPTSWSVDDLTEKFSKFGPVSSAIVVNDEEGNSRGFGFVNFADADSAGIAKDAMHENVVIEDGEEYKLYATRAQKKRERDRMLEERYHKMRMDLIQKFEGCNLYIKNLDDDISEEKLRDAFNDYGTIRSVKIMKNESGASRGFGFVCFENQEEATNAITTMNGSKTLGEKPLYVSLAQRREIRRRQLQQQFSMRRSMMGGFPVGVGAPLYYQGGQQQMMGGRPPFPMMMGGHNGPSGGRGNRGDFQGHRGQGGQRRGRRQQGGRGGRGYHLTANARNQRGMQMGPAPVMPPMPPHMMPMNPPQGMGMPGQHPGMYQPMMMPPQMQGAPMQAPLVAAPPAAAQQPAAPAAAPAETVLEPLTADKLAAASAEDQKNLLGERLYPKIFDLQPERAGKITGMLLEMENTELLNLLESPDQLTQKVKEAVNVLNEHSNIE